MSRGPAACDFIEACCRVTKQSVGGNVGDLIRLRGWQRKMINGLLATRDGKLAHRQALIGLPRKNTKTTDGACLALEGLVLGVPGGEVYSVAGDREQARICFGMAKRMVELDPDLSDLIKPYRDALEVPATGSVYRVRSAEAGLSEGLSPTRVIFDEVHVQPTRELWDVMALGSGAREEPLMVGITTAGVRTDRYGNDSLAYQLYQYGRRVATGEVDDPTFFFAWWEPADPNADHTDPKVWREANPGYGDLVSVADFESAVKRTPEAEWRTKRLNQWVSSAQVWLPGGAWDKCESDRKIEDGARVVLGFDGSRSGDATALVACTIEATPHLEAVGVWEKPIGERHDWRVPIGEVMDTIRETCRRLKVVEIVADSSLWQRELEELQDERLPVVEFPQSPARMIPATQRFYEVVVERHLTHSGDPRFARHVANATVKQKPGGVMIYKDSHSSPRKIDLAVAGVMAVERAAVLARSGGGVGMYSIDDIEPDEMERLMAEERAYQEEILREAAEMARARQTAATL